MEHVQHPFAPVFDKNSKILILGSFPSVKSREIGFYYSHPQNRFWRVIADILSVDPVPGDITGKKLMLLNGGIAVWDVADTCDIKGSSDPSIKNVKPNKIEDLLKGANIKKLYANGLKSYTLYTKLCYPNVGIKIKVLPSTSPANASYSYESLKKIWRQELIPELI